MAVFTEQMEMLTNELLTSRKDRDAFVTDVQQRSHKIVADAQTFVHVLGQEHGVMAERLRKDLATNSQERLSAVKAQRQQNREHHQAMRKSMQEAQAQTRRQRQQHVAELRAECQTVQKDLASDLRQAAQVWQRMFHAVAKTNGDHKGKVTVTIGQTATGASPPVKAGETAKSQKHAHSHEAESKKPNQAATPASPPVKAMVEPKKPTPETPPASPPVKVMETAKPQAAESKKPNQETPPGNPGKVMEQGHPH